MYFQLFLTLHLSATLSAATSLHYTPDWESIDSRPLPQWYDDAKVGVFIHWGVFSVPSYGPKGESAFLWPYWLGGEKAYVEFMQKNYPPDFTYADFAASFHAEFYNPDQWADIFKRARVKYIVLTSKHHEGFTNWPSKVSWNWNSMDVGPKRDLVGDLAAAIRNRTNIRFGLYHSLFEWYNPLYLADKAANFKTQKFIEAKTLPELYEIVNTYKPDVLWSDGDWEAPDVYWNSTQFLAWLYNESPVRDTVVTNDRWGSGIACHHGGFYTCSDKFNPKVLQKHKWENCMTLDYYSWGYRRNLEFTDVMDIHTLIQTLVETISCGGNLLMNIGPTGDGRIAPIFEQRLRQFGDWMLVNDEAIYSTRPWIHQNDTLTPGVWYTSKLSGKSPIVYAITLSWPLGGVLTLGSATPTAQTSVTMLGYKGRNIKWVPRPEGGMDILMPILSDNKMPCQWAWTFKLANVV
jgi:alpha-L-fucosidase